MKHEIKDHALETISDDEAMLLEESLWWLKGRKYIIRDYLCSARKLFNISKIMDIGCGSGGYFDVLAGFGRVVGVERSPVLAERARSRKIAEDVFQEDVLTMTDFSGIELFSLFDVLEHIENDELFLKQLAQNVPQKHMLMLSLPACPFLFSEHDRILHHYRRYSKDNLISLLNQCGYEIVKVNYFMCILFPFVMFSRLKEKIFALLGRKQNDVNLGSMPHWLSLMLEYTLRIETLLSKYISLPVGLWLFVLATRRDRNVE